MKVNQNPFLVKVSAVLVTSISFIEVFSIFGLTISAIPTFIYPKELASPVMIVLSILGVYSLLKRNRSMYMGILASVSWIVLACFSIVEVNRNVLNLDSVISPFVVTTFGFISIICIFKTNPLKSDLNNYESDSGTSQTRNNSNVNTIEMSNVSKKYFLESNVISAVNNLNMKILKGEFVSIMGPSGSGKSTILNLIGALDKPSSGQVLIDGVDISSLDDEGLAHLRNEKIGFVFQAYNLISRSTVLRNMELPALVMGITGNERRKKVDNLLDIVGLGDKILRKPKTLSGGEQQRVAIARALINDPEIVLADEPTGNVDSKTSIIIMNFLRKLNSEKGTTIIVVTHDPEVANMTDRIIYIRDGKIFNERTIGVPA